MSVIIPVYNLEHHLDPMLLSLREQETEYSVEIIFVLNNCTDDSEGVIWRSGLDCRILTCEQQGCGCARNKGLEYAHGDYIWFMDGDDWLLDKTAIQKAVTRVKRDDLNILLIPFESNRFKRAYFSMVWQYVLRFDFIKEYQFPAIQPAEDDVYMRKVLWKAGYNERTYQSLPQLEEPLYFYNYMREGSNMYRVIVKGEKI